jgi:dynein regulatory complex protein 1
MREDYITQLSEIENSFKDERSQILERNLQEINDLFLQHSQIEEEAQRNRARLEEDYQQQLEQLRTKDANDQAEQKRKLETEMQVLEQCMEDMKAVYKLNEEKLDFNLRVLKERKSLNDGTIKNLTLKQRKSRDTLSRAKKKFETQSMEAKKKNIQYTEAYKEFTRKFKELQEKFKRFEKSDQIRFNEIWQMNDQEVKQLIRKIVDADKVIHM